MKRTREQNITANKWWTVTKDNQLLYEGLKTHCKEYMRENGLLTLHSRGDVKFEIVKNSTI